MIEITATPMTNEYGSIYGWTYTAHVDAPSSKADDLRADIDEAFIREVGEERFYGASGDVWDQADFVVEWAS